ncbi:MAG TPA: TPM domain-containing protein [Draconibacterium sp.]|nr:TPM domain-containing protein [Draconibacterium sp.]
MRKIITIITIALLFHHSVFAQIPDRPNPPRLVNDYAHVLNQNEYNSLESSLEQFARETSTQILVVTVEDLEGYAPGDYAQRLGEKWGVGQKGKDNGIVILLKPKKGVGKGQVFVATGYGLEGVLPDAVVNGTVVDNEMIPRFKQDDYFGGLVSGIKVIMDITRGEYTAAQYQQKVGNQKSGGIPALIFMVLFFVIFPILRMRRRRFYSPGRSLPFWLAMGMMSGRSSHSGTFNNFSSGSGGFGGFGGFGGGSFGGGGAGGSW